MMEQYEHKSEPLLPLRQFFQRMLSHGLLAFALIVVSLGIGVLGYRLTEGMDWVDALLNAAMILGGMGPVNPLYSTAGKYFASFYALFSGVIFLASMGIVLAPVAHRLLHRLHLEQPGSD